MHNCVGLSSLKCEILPYVREALGIIYHEVKMICKLENWGIMIQAGRRQ